VTDTQNAVAHSVQRAFLTARLLTGSVRCAEAAVGMAIRRWDERGALEDALLRGAVEVSLTDCAFPQDPPDEAALPDALRGVLGLSPRLRRPYVLRALAQWPAETCARMLGLTERQVERRTGIAAARLAASFTSRNERREYEQAAG
jgi:DNA-directed RNA polymerase specialized sigma24 family protein